MDPFIILPPHFIPPSEQAKLSVIQSALDETPPTFPRVQDVRWRVDVHISNAVLNKLLKPAVLMQLVMKDGGVSTFEAPI